MSWKNIHFDQPKLFSRVAVITKDAEGDRFQTFANYNGVHKGKHVFLAEDGLKIRVTFWREAFPFPEVEVSTTNGIIPLQVIAKTYFEAANEVIGSEHNDGGDENWELHGLKAVHNLQLKLPDRTMKFSEILKVWAYEQGFMTWSEGHAVVLSNLSKWMDLHK